MRRTVCTFLALICLAAAPAVEAINGINLIGYNARSSGMGGADVALDGDCAGCNPATIGGEQINTLHLGTALLLPRGGMRNTLLGPNDANTKEKIFPAPYFEYARRPGADSPWTLGINIQAIGGLGVKFEDIRTLVGNTDELKTDVKIARISPTFSYRMSERLRLGAALQIGYTKQSFRLFPNTYSPGPDGLPGTQDDFVGLEISGLSGTGVAGRFGLHYRASDKLSLALTLTTETSLDLEDGRLYLNLGTTRVAYDAKMSDFALPQEVEAGFAYRLTPKLLLAGDLRWINWSATMDELVVQGSNPSLPVPITAPSVPFKLKWDNQLVIALGLEYALAPHHILRAGYNYGKSPIPDEYISPLFIAHVERHVTIGYSYVQKRYRVDVGWEHSIKHNQFNTNPNLVENPFGPDLQVLANHGDVLHLGMSYRF